MVSWKHLILLLRNKSSLTRVLTEIELKRLGKVFPQDIQLLRVLIAGGARGLMGTERVLLEQFKSSAHPVLVNINQTASPDIIADLTCSWPFRSEVFGMIISTWVLEHLKDPLIFFREAYRVLKQGGFLVATVPFLYREHGSPYDYWRFTATALRHLAESAGFSVVQVKRVGGSPMLSTIALLWPLFPIPVLGVCVALLAIFIDHTLLLFSRLFRKRQEVINSYPISYILCALKKIK